MPYNRENGKGKKGEGKGKFKGDKNKRDVKGKGKRSVKKRHFDGYCNQCGGYGHKKPDCAGKGKNFHGTCDKCGAHGHKKSDCPAKTMAQVESGSVHEPSEPAGWKFSRKGILKDLNFAHCSKNNALTASVSQHQAQRVLPVWHHVFAKACRLRDIGKNSQAQAKTV